MCVCVCVCVCYTFDEKNSIWCFHYDFISGRCVIFSYAASQRHSNKDAMRLLYNNILPFTLFVSFERVVPGLRVRGRWGPNITEIF